MWKDLERSVVLPNVSVRKSAWPWLFVSGIIIILDQFSKHLVAQHFFPGQAQRLLSFLNIRLSYNSGSAFGFLSDMGGWQVLFLILFVCVIAVVLIVWLIRTERSESLLAFGLSLIIGGALGNLIDRVRWGYVVDFVDFHLKGWHFATFNLGDSAVCVGAVLLIIHFLFFSKG